MERKAWIPNPVQAEALSRTEHELLLGGARGGGKTDAGIIWMAENAKHPRFRGLVIRRNFDDLSDWIDRAKLMYTPLDARFTTKPDRFVFPSGAIIRLGHLKDDDAFTKYQGHEYHRILIEELTHIPSEESYLKLISSCRSTVDGLKPQIFCTTNPGGPGHTWVRTRFVTPAAPGTPFYIQDKATGLKQWRIFIPATVEDNPILMQKDPNYVAWLNQLPEELRKAWRDGSWDVFETKGAYYATEMALAQRTGRVTGVPWEPSLPVHTGWDLGYNDSMSIWFAQFVGREIRLIDCMEYSKTGINDILPDLKNKGYTYGTHYFPHDMAVHDVMTGKSRIEVFDEFYTNLFGISPTYSIAPRTDILDGIQAVRLLLPRMLFDQVKCQRGIQCMSQYRSEYDEKNLVFKNQPLHDQYSHMCDAMRCLAVCYEGDYAQHDTSYREESNLWAGRLS